MTTPTVIDALKAQVQYPLPTNFFLTVMVKRGLDGDSNCTKETLDSVAFKGAHADCIRQILLYPGSISEGGMSISKTDRKSLLDMANRLYREIGEEPIDERPKVTFY